MHIRDLAIYHCKYLNTPLYTDQPRNSSRNKQMLLIIISPFSAVYIIIRPETLFLIPVSTGVILDDRVHRPWKQPVNTAEKGVIVCTKPKV